MAPYRAPYDPFGVFERNPGDLPKGSGSGLFARGPQVASIGEVRIGDLIIEDNAQFSATNLIKVVARPADTVAEGEAPPLDDDLFYGQFADPRDPGKPRLYGDRPFVVFDFYLAARPGQYFRALPR